MSVTAEVDQLRVHLAEMTSVYLEYTESRTVGNAIAVAALTTTTAFKEPNAAAIEAGKAAIEAGKAAIAAAAPDGGGAGGAGDAPSA